MYILVTYLSNKYYSFRVEKTFISCRGSLENHSRFATQKSYSIILQFQRHPAICSGLQKQKEFVEVTSTTTIMLSFSSQFDLNFSEVVREQAPLGNHL